MSRNNEPCPLGQRLERLSHKALATPSKSSLASTQRTIPPRDLSRIQTAAAKTIVMMQIRADEAKSRNCQTDNANAVLEAVLKREAELAREEAVELRRRQGRISDPGDDGFDQ
jgi:hypothetical protein